MQIPEVIHPNGNLHLLAAEREIRRRFRSASRSLRSCGSSSLVRRLGATRRKSPAAALDAHGHGTTAAIASKGTAALPDKYHHPSCSRATRTASPAPRKPPAIADKQQNPSRPLISRMTPLPCFQATAGGRPLGLLSAACRLPRAASRFLACRGTKAYNDFRCRGADAGRCEAGMDKTWQ